MKIWVLSQDGTKLIEVIELHIGQDNKHIGGFMSDGSYRCLGEYATKELTEKVFKKIIKLIHVCIDSELDNIYNIQDNIWINMLQIEDMVK